MLPGVGQATILLGQVLGREAERQVSLGQRFVADVQVNQMSGASDSLPHVRDVGMFLRTVPGIVAQAA